MAKVKKYWVHYDEDNQQYWIGVVVANMFVQQVGPYYQHKKTAQRVAAHLNQSA